MFAGHPYGFQVSGSADVVKSITPDEMRKFHSRVVAPSRMVLSVFGDIERDKIVALVQSRFGNLVNGAGPALGRTTTPSPKAIEKAHKFMSKEQAAVLIGFPGISVDSPDRYAVDVLTGFLNSQGGKLFQVLRDERGLAYSVGAFDIAGVDPGALVLYIVTVPEKRVEATNGMLEVVKDLRTNGLSNEELERSKVEALGKHAIELQTNGQIAAQASFDELYGLGYDNYKSYDSKIRSLSADDIKRVASTILDLNRYVIVDVGNYEAP
jgi:zinc protease